MTPSRRSDGDVIEAEFAVTDASYPFASIARSADCRIVLEKVLPREQGRQAEYFRVVGADPGHVVDLVSADAVVEARPLVTIDDGGIVEVVVEDGCPVRYLAKQGAVPTTVEGTPGGAKIVAEIMPGDDPGTIVGSFLDEHAVELVAKRTKAEPTPLLEAGEFEATAHDRLTERQWEVLRTAFDAGYYQRPRERTGEEIAAELDIAPTTFQEHLRAAERKLVSSLIEED